MFKRCFSPLTLVNQLALIVMLSTAIGVAGMAVSGWLVQGVQGSAHAINKAGSLRMQSYRLLAAVPLDAKDQKLLDEMEQTAFSPELTRAAERDGQQKQLKALQDYWHNELSPGLQHAQNAHAVAEDVTRFVAGLDRLVTSFDHTTELRIERVVFSSPGNGDLYGAIAGIYDYLATCSPFAALETVVINGARRQSARLYPACQYQWTQ